MMWVALFSLIFVFVGLTVSARPAIYQYCDPWERWPEWGDLWERVGLIIMIVSFCALIWSLFLVFLL